MNKRHLTTLLCCSALLGPLANAANYHRRQPVDISKTPAQSPQIKELRQLMAGRWRVAGTGAHGHKVYSGMVKVKPMAKGQYWVIRYRAGIYSIVDKKEVRQRNAFMVMNFPKVGEYKITSYQTDGDIKPIRA